MNNVIRTVDKAMMEWKAGDMAMVEIQSRNQFGNVRIKNWCSASGDAGVVYPSGLSPIPPAITPEERAVVEAAVACEMTPIGDSGTLCLKQLAFATRTLIASRTPHDPLAKLVAALAELVASMDEILIAPGSQGVGEKAIARYRAEIDAARKVVAK